LTLNEKLLLEELNEKSLGAQGWDKRIHERAWVNERCYPGRPETLLMAVSKLGQEYTCLIRLSGAMQYDV
jgi:hypothetical protein